MRLDRRGLVYDIQKYSIHDGPGIRTLVFLKGCSLKCVWCCNPESIDPKPEVFFDNDRCIGCGKCGDACPIEAIERTGSRLVFNRDLCIKCGRCCNICPTKARKLIGQQITVNKVLEEIEKDRVFYNNSGGGVTIAGGEPTFQSNFLLDLLKACKWRDIHTIVETNGYVEWRMLEEVLQYTDLVFFDLKHMDSEKHKELTGVRNDLILENAKKIVQKRFPLVMRLPLIPKHNLSVENIETTIKFLVDLKKIREVHLLPYHSFGEQKYVRLGKKYQLHGLAPPSDLYVERLKETMERHGLKVRIGG